MKATEFGQVVEWLFVKFQLPRIQEVFNFINLSATILKIEYYLNTITIIIIDIDIPVVNYSFYYYCCCYYPSC